MSDLLVKLYDDKIDGNGYALKGNIRIIHPMTPNRETVLQFVREHFSEKWASESEAAFDGFPVRMWIAVDGKQIVGFACYDCTMRGFFGPIGVDESYRGQGVGRALLLHCLNSMREMGYGYAVIGSVSPNRYNFYHNACGAQEIVDSGLSIYKDLL